MSDELGVVVPAYRPDVDRLVAYVEELVETLSPAVVLVELDEPSSGDVETLRASSATVHVADRRRGKGAAITHGFERLNTDLLAFADADGSTSADMLGQVVAALRDGADVAVGSRRHPDAVVETHQTHLRRRLGDTFAALSRAALDVPLYDFQCGAKALTDAAWRRVRNHVYEGGFAWDLELLAVAQAQGLEIREVPIRWADREGSTVDTVRTTADMLRALVSVRHRVKRLEGSTLHRLADWRPPKPLVQSDAVRDR